MESYNTSPSQKVKYLGLFLDHHLAWAQRIKCLAALRVSTLLKKKTTHTYNNIILKLIYMHYLI